MQEIVRRMYVVRNILDTAKANAEATYFLHWPKNSKIATFVEGTLFLNIVRTSLLRTATIEIFKITSKSRHDKFRFVQLFDDLKAYLSADESDQIISKYKKVEDQVINIKSLRNKRYGHQDDDPGILENNILELLLVVDTCREIFKDIVIHLGLNIEFTLHDDMINVYNGKHFIKHWCEFD